MSIVVLCRHGLIGACGGHRHCRIGYIHNIWFPHNNYTIFSSLTDRYDGTHLFCTIGNLMLLYCVRTIYLASRQVCITKFFDFSCRHSRLNYLIRS
jgi:hypothetical protein